MEILKREEIYNYTQDKDNIHSLLKIADQSIDRGVYEDLPISDNLKTQIITIIGKLNYQHHNDGQFFTKICDIFSIDGHHQVIEGQEDVAVMTHNDIGLIFRSAEPGVYLSIKCPREDITYKEESIKELLDLIYEGFNNKSKFDAIMLNHQLSDELITQNSQIRKNKI